MPSKRKSPDDQLDEFDQALSSAPNPKKIRPAAQSKQRRLAALFPLNSKLLDVSLNAMHTTLRVTRSLHSVAANETNIPQDIQMFTDMVHMLNSWHGKIYRVAIAPGRHLSDTYSLMVALRAIVQGDKALLKRVVVEKCHKSHISAGGAIEVGDDEDPPARFGAFALDELFADGSAYDIQDISNSRNMAGKSPKSDEPLNRQSPQQDRTCEPQVDIHCDEEWFEKNPAMQRAVPVLKLILDAHSW